MKVSALIILSLLILQPLSAQVKLTYIANEGVLLEGKSHKVMIDALFDDYYKDYLSPDEATIKKMMTAEAPFDKVNLVLSTHIHRDHFEANIAGDFLKNHSETQLISSEQIKNELASKYVDFKHISNRVKGHQRGVYTLRDEINGVTVYSFFIYHAGGERTRSIENMGFIVELDGKHILHLGDAEMNPKRFEELDLGKYEIDMALVPYWYMSDDTGRVIIDDHIKAKALVGVHYPKAPSKMALQEIKRHYPQATVFQTAYQTVEF